MWFEVFEPPVALYVLRVIFYGTAGLLLYSWVLYPVLLTLMTARERRRGRVKSANFAGRFPSLSMVLAAYNEQDTIGAKIRNFLASNYPGESELLIVSDGSRDGTVEAVSNFVSSRVRLFAETVRRGKGGALARVLSETRGEIVVFTDATSIFTPDTLTNLIRPFADPKVGLVTGRVKVEGSVIAGLYRRYEDVIENLEQQGGVISTAHGCIYAMRRELWHEHDPRLTNDFFHPIVVNLQGSDCAVASDAICAESFSPDFKVQFQRQVRMVALAALIYFKCVPVLLRARNWRSLFVLTSHKLLRWLTVPSMVLFAASSIALAGYRPFYATVLAAESLFWGVVLLGGTARHFGLSGRFTFPAQFVALNLAAALGIWELMRGRVPVKWETTTFAVFADDLRRQSEAR